MVEMVELEIVVVEMLVIGSIHRRLGREALVSSVTNQKIGEAAGYEGGGGGPLVVHMVVVEMVVVIVGGGSGGDGVDGGGGG